MTPRSEQPKEQQQREGKAYYHSDITPEVLENIQIGDWIRGIGDISCPFDQRVVQTVGTWLRMHDTRSRPHPAPARDFVDTPEKPWCYPGCMLVINAKVEAARKAREDVLEAIQDHNNGRLKGMEILFATPSNERTESAQDAYLKEAYFELTLIKHLIESLRSTTPHTEKEQPR